MTLISELPHGTVIQQKKSKALYRVVKDGVNRPILINLETFGETSGEEIEFGYDLIRYGEGWKPTPGNFARLSDDYPAEDISDSLHVVYITDYATDGLLEISLIGQSDKYGGYWTFVNPDYLEPVDHSVDELFAQLKYQYLAGR